MECSLKTIHGQYASKKANYSQGKISISFPNEKEICMKSELFCHFLDFLQVFFLVTAFFGTGNIASINR